MYCISGGLGHNTEAGLNSLFSERTSNNSELAMSGHILPVKVVSLTYRTANQSLSVISVYLSVNTNKFKSEQASAAVSSDLWGFSAVT